jgi:hypothetical protein
MFALEKDRNLFYLELFQMKQEINAKLFWWFYEKLVLSSSTNSYVK